MRANRHVFGICLCVTLLITSAVESMAFALLGPVQPWMQQTNGVILPGDIGGPMSIGSGYRWNVPVLTYGFDQSFLNYFGTNGVAAVTGAIQILNSLPPASQIVLTNYLVRSQHFNYEAESEYLCDLKSATLSLLLEHMGLASPWRYVYVIQQWDPSLINESGYLLPDVFGGTNLVNYIIARNYDPLTLNVSPYVNGILCDGDILYLGNGYEVVPYSTVPSMPLVGNAVADLPQPYQMVLTWPLIPDRLDPAAFYTGLTLDDVGGLAYLLSTNTVNYETLLSDVTGAGTNLNSFVNGAWRPGVDKITFIPQPVDPQSGLFLPSTNYFTDSYITNGILQHQQMQRVVVKPDFVFSTGDLYFPNGNVSFYQRTGTTNWQNNAAANGNLNGGGPGVIQPPVQIVFQKLGMSLESWHSLFEGWSSLPSYWGSYDPSTNPPIAYPVQQSGTNQVTLRMWLTLASNAQSEFTWEPSSLWGASFAFQTSTDLMSWTTLFMLTNNNSVLTYYDYYPTNSAGFYRLIPQ